MPPPIVAAAVLLFALVVYSATGLPLFCPKRLSREGWLSPVSTLVAPARPALGTALGPATVPAPPLCCCCCFSPLKAFGSWLWRSKAFPPVAAAARPPPVMPPKAAEPPPPPAPHVVLAV